MGQTLRASAGRPDTPNIHLSWFPWSAYEIDPLPVLGPSEEVIMGARVRTDIDLLRASAGAVRNEDWIAGIGSLIHNAGPVGRPGWLHGTLRENATGCSADGSPQAET